MVTWYLMVAFKRFPPKASIYGDLWGVQRTPHTLILVMNTVARYVVPGKYVIHYRTACPPTTQASIVPTGYYARN